MALKQDTGNTIINLPEGPDLKVVKGGKKATRFTEKNNVYQELEIFNPGSNGIPDNVYLPLQYQLNRFVKRTTDVLISSLVIVFILSWLLPLLALITWLNIGGPVFFLQKRNKRGGGEFTCIKLRTMIRGQNDELNITQLGRFLRAHFIDELPQFLNVWWGDMSLIGPRPHMVEDNRKYEKLVEDYQFRHKVKPGITGLAQVLGYVGKTYELEQMKDRVFLDHYYVRHWSILLDIKIFFRTFLRIAGI